MITMESWRESPEQMKDYAKYRASPLGLAEREVLVDECSKMVLPVNVVDSAGKAHAENALFILGFMAGKRYMVELQDSMKEFKAPEEPKETFEDPTGERKEHASR
jgi:hypothetical protein